MEQERIVAPDGEEAPVDFSEEPGMNQAERDEYESHRTQAAGPDEPPEGAEVTIDPRHRPGMNQAEADELESKTDTPQAPTDVDK